jgi:hypothetical protein
VVGLTILVLALIASVVIGFSDWPESISAPPIHSPTSTASL